MQKHLFRVLASITLVLTLAGNNVVDVSAGSTPVCPCELPGDVNDDSVTDFYDFAAAFVFVYTQPTPEFLPCDGQSDPDGNGQIQAVDYLLLQKWAFQVLESDSIPVCAPQ